MVFSIHRLFLLVLSGLGSLADEIAEGEVTPQISDGEGWASQSLPQAVTLVSGPLLAPTHLVPYLLGTAFGFWHPMQALPFGEPDGGVPTPGRWDPHDPG